MKQKSKRAKFHQKIRLGRIPKKILEEDEDRKWQHHHDKMDRMFRSFRMFI
jgi:hypothetical protein